MSKSCSLLVLALVATACGPEVEVKASRDWMLGTFSNRYVGDKSTGLNSLGHYEFREDGTLALIGVMNCGENREELRQEHKWARAGDWLVIVDMPEGATDEEWRVRPGETCNTLQLNQVQYGKELRGFPLWRGAVCTKKLPPCQVGVECVGCETVWCDEPPPPCGE